MSESIDLNEIARRYKQATESEYDGPFPDVVVNRKGELVKASEANRRETSIIESNPFAMAKEGGR
jgi:hypothetical protein